TPVQFARGNKGTESGDEQSVLMNLERNFPASTNVTEAFLKLTTDDAQLNHDGHFPVVARKKIRAILEVKKFTVKWDPFRAVVSSCNDFAYTYGKYTREEGAQSQAAVRTGYYVHLWRRDAKGQWRLAVEVSRPI